LQLLLRLSAVRILDTLSVIVGSQDPLVAFGKPDLQATRRR